MTTKAGCEWMDVFFCYQLTHSLVDIGLLNGLLIFGYI